MSRLSTLIFSKKRTKSNISKTWKHIFIGYIRLSKHLRIWVPHTHQVLIASKLVVKQGKTGTDLLVEYSLPPSEKPL